MKKLLWLWKHRNDPKLILLRGLAFYIEQDGYLYVSNEECANLEYESGRTCKVQKDKGEIAMLSDMERTVKLTATLTGWTEIHLLEVK